jgi:Leucine Rich repeat
MWHMSTTPPAGEPADTLPADLPAAAPRKKTSKKGRVLILAALLLCLIGSGAYVKWSEARDETNTQTARRALEADGIAVIEAAAEPDESSSPFERWSTPKIVRIQSSSNRITDAELPKIAAITQDVNLVLSSCPITNDGLSALAGKHNVRCLVLAKTSITDDGIKHLQGMNLQSLDLSATKITDVGLATLEQMDFPHLKEIALERTHVTNDGLMRLAKFKNLEWVSVAGTKVTKDGVRHLKAKLPETTFLE